MHTEQNPDDCVEVAGLKVSARVGVYPHELLEPRLLTASLTLWSSAIGEAARSDQLADTLDYSALCEAVRAACAEKPFQLIEAVAGRVVEVCLEDPRVACARVRIAKPGAVALAGEVAVVIVRRRAAVT